MKVNSFMCLIKIFLVALIAMPLWSQSPSISNLDKSYNYTAFEQFDITGKVIAKGVVFYDELGKTLQSQNYNFKTQSVWASQNLYDTYGLPEISSFATPIGNRFLLNLNLIRKNSDFIDQPEKLSAVTIQATTLGDYYGNASKIESGRDITNFPFNRLIYDPLNPGKILKTIGGNQVDTNGDGILDSNPQSFSFTMPAAQELYYAFGREHFKEEAAELLELYGNNQNITEASINESKQLVTLKVSKIVNKDVHGVETVIFQDDEGKILATARSGEGPVKQVLSLIGQEGFVDIHIPKGCEGSLNFLRGRESYEVYNLENSSKLENSVSIPAGFFRIVSKNKVSEPAVSYINKSDGKINAISSNNYGVSYNINYSDYSLNYYNKAGKLIKSLPPIGFDNSKYATYTMASIQIKHINPLLQSTLKYNTLGQLTQSHSPDEGDAWFLYRKDGQIRFSINSKQWKEKKFSYTHYDERGRPVESGIFHDLELLYLNPYTTTITKQTEPFKASLKSIIDIASGDGIPNYRRYDVVKTDYDEFADANVLPNGYKNPTFLAGNVAKTENDHTQTWYSYDIYGRVTWVVQKIAGLNGFKTIDYNYDPVTGEVVKVYYQKGQTDQFIHKYLYDPIDYSLVKVETSTNDQTFTEHASYNYYETGALKRVDLAQGLQGIDYVYNLQGQLKSINHPSLKAANDPGGDDDDLFGMIIDYNYWDYNRPLKNIKSTTYGKDQFNGNIKGIRWNSSSHKLENREHTYSYEYNNNNWLKKAEYGEFTGDYSSTPAIHDKIEGTADEDHIEVTIGIHQPQQSSKHVLANKSITLVPGFEVTAFALGANKEFTAKISGSDPVRDINSGSFVKNNNGDYQVDNLTYDANGNIQSLHRNKHTEGGKNAMDQLSYRYDANKPNQLVRVDDAVITETNADDIKDQNGKNYEYNEIGQLVKNNQDNIEYIYNTSGLVTEIKKAGVMVVEFLYNDRGHRIRKVSYAPGSGRWQYSVYYVRDIAGSTLAVYRKDSKGTRLIENTIFGASRLGVRKADNSYLYQLTDHLGNVRSVIKKLPDGNALAVTATDYYPFGMPMPNRNLQGDYRYAFQGQEKDPETGKEAFELRLWDSRIGRWLTTDPYGQFNSPYLGMHNNPINAIDPDGGYSTWLGAAWGWAKGGFKGSIKSIDNPATKYHKYAIDNSTDDILSLNFGDISGKLSDAGGFVNDQNVWKFPSLITAYEPDWADNLAEGNFAQKAIYSTANAFSIVGQSMNPFDNQVTTLRGEDISDHDRGGYGAEVAGTLLPIGGAASGARYGLGSLISKTARIHSRITSRGWPGIGQRDIGHRAATFFRKEILTDGKIQIQAWNNIRFYHKIGNRNFDIAFNPWKWKIFHEGPF